MKPVVVQLWEESERGWGVRPDGYTLHLTNEDRDEYIKQYWAAMPGSPPDEYSRPSGSPYIFDVNEDVYAKLVELKSLEQPGMSGPIGKNRPTENG